MAEGKLFVISGPSGVGKGTICKRILEGEGKTKFSVSMTTRLAREGEEDGKDYFFVSKDEFIKLLGEGGLLEHNNYCDNYYGTPRKNVVDWMKAGYDVILEIDYNGAFQVRESYPECILVFILPPSMKQLEERILGRGSETDETLKKRLIQAKDEMAQADKYDYQIVNDDLDDAVKRVCEIMEYERNKEE